MILLENKRIRFEYEVIETLSAGMVLEGWEVKSLRSKHGSLKSAWIKITENETWLENFQIPAWPFSTQEQNKNRSKKLLLTKKEIHKLQRKTKEKGITLVPLSIQTQGKHIKCEIALGKGRKKYEKKERLKERDVKRQTAQTLKKFAN